MTFTIAACNYIFREVDSFDGFTAHVREMLDAAGESDLVVLPEAICMELMTALPRWDTADVPYLAETKNYAPEISQFFEDEAKARGMFILGGTHLRDEPEGLRNIAQVHGPDGLVAEHIKTHLFPAERELGTGEGDDMEAFDLGFVKAGINICYEAEIPECSASLVAQGAELVLTPSLTFTEAGFWRVRHCVEANCVENQIFSVHSCAGGPARGVFPGGYAQTLICAPCDKPWPSNGLLAETEPNVDGVVTATLDTEALAENRANGAATVLNDRRRRADLYTKWPTHVQYV